MATHSTSPSSALISASEACRRLGISRRTLYDLIQRGDVRAYKLGNSTRSNIRIDAESLRDFLDRRRIETDTVQP